LIWIFAVTIAYPYVPGSSTDAFKGVSVFVGLMVSLGSAGLVNQVMSGLVVVYSRALKPGEFVRVGDDLGTVSEIGTLSTKILTRKREEITIPNAVLVGSKTVNYSRHAAGDGAVVATTLTIGYDAPWRLVQALLLQAAARTTGVRKEPAPRVLQKALSDFYIQYDLIINIDRPEERSPILSELHTHILDAFNEHSVQIMSPHFESQPHEKVFVPRSQWFRQPSTEEANLNSDKSTEGSNGA
jgi:small-conductance mechanosensitive channel